LWIIINDKVYDVTNYDDHDGGFDVFMDYAGKDATVGFEGKDENDHNHSKKAI
jgi:cytochrome b involved in lipid metabolism